MIEAFLKAKHWQLFVIMFGIPMILQFTIMGMVISNVIVSNGQPNIELMFDYYKLIPLIMIISYGFYFGWFWSIVMGLKDKLPETVKINILRFKIFFFVPLIYMVFISAIIYYSYTVNLFVNFDHNTPPSFVPNIETVLMLVAIFVPIHFFSIFCIYYVMYISAKIIKSIELNRNVSFGDFIGEFVMFWFYPIGIWFLQPKINRMIKDDTIGVNPY